GSPIVKGITVAGLKGFGKFCPSWTPRVRSPADGGAMDVPCAAEVGTSVPRASTVSSAAQRCFMCLLRLTIEKACGDTPAYGWTKRANRREHRQPVRQCQERRMP